ncbi:MAG: hypothetical protein R3326_04055, partial [Gemmatimonadota bacterium]|nr:hypothetical protein [Gemmatimonadota bacterium]
MRQTITLLLALFVSVAFAACGETPAGIDHESSAITPAGPPGHAPAKGVRDVVVDENPEAGWVFNAEPPYVTPAGFSLAESSLGSGSIHVDPITNAAGNAAKFILRYVPDSEILLSDFDGFSIDFLIDDAGSSFDANQFYVNFYALTPDPGDGGWYDCRF